MKMFFTVNYLLVILCLFYGTTTSAQTATCTLKGIEIHAIKDTVSVGNSNDSIRYIINTPTKERKPVVLFIQGSGNRSLLAYDDTSSICYFTGSPFNWTSLKDQFYFVFISKPATPLRKKYSEANSAYDTTISTYREFTLNDTKDYYVKSTVEVIQHLRQQSYIDTSKVYVVGHSQGASVVCKLAALYPHLVNKAIYASASPFGRSVENIIDIEHDVLLQRLTAEDAQNKIDQIYADQKHLKTYCEYALKNKIVFPMNNYSFDFDPSINYFHKIKIPTLVVYGTADRKSKDLSLLPFFLINNGQENIIMKTYPGYDHNFFKVDKLGNPIFEEYHWDIVFGDMMDWLNN